MNAAQERRLDAQAQQMAFEMGFAPDPAKAEYAAREAEQERQAYQGKMDRDDAMAAHPSHGRALTTEREATTGQIAFIKRLVDERVVVPGTELHGVLEVSRHLAVQGVFTVLGASKLIDALKAAPYKGKQASSAPARELSDGIYVVEGDGDSDIYKLQIAVHGSGQLIAKRLVIDWETVMGKEQVEKKGTFRYLGLASKHLPLEARRMTLEEAKQFGSIYGFCVRCGRTLTDEGSIAAGIGPICADKM